MTNPTIYLMPSFYTLSFVTYVELAISDLHHKLASVNSLCEQSHDIRSWQFTVVFPLDVWLIQNPESYLHVTIILLEVL